MTIRARYLFLSFVRRSWGIILGLGLTVYFLSRVDLHRIGEAMGAVGAGIILLILLHLFAIILDAQGWKSILDRMQARVSRRVVTTTACIRNAVQTLVPIGASGFVAGYRSLSRHDVKPHSAVTSLIFETTLTTGVELVLLVTSAVMVFADKARPIQQQLFAYVPLVVGLAAILGLALASQIWGGVLDRLSRWLLALGLRASLARTTVRIKHDLRDLYRSPRIVALASLWQLTSLLAGSACVWLVFELAHHGVSFAVAVLFLCLSRSIRSFGFLIPSAWGLQEGLFIILAPLAGVSSALGLAASLILRVRDFVFAFLVLGLGWLIQHLTKSKFEKGIRPMPSHQPTSFIDS